MNVALFEITAKEWVVRYCELTEFLQAKTRRKKCKLGKQPKVATLRYDKPADLSEQSGESERCVHSEGDGTERAAYGTE